MARIRTIKPEFWTDEDLAEISEPALLLAIGLLNHADDEGYFRANPALVKAAVFPIREPSVNVHGMFTELSNIGYISLFEGSDGKKYGLINGFTRHQRVSHPYESKIKNLAHSRNVHGTFTECSGLNREQGTGKGIKEKGEKEKPATKPRTRANTINLHSLPHEISPEVAKDFVQHRKLMKAPLTQRAFDLAMRAAMNASTIGMTPDQLIDETIQAGWKGINITWMKNRMEKDNHEANRPNHQPSAANRNEQFHETCKAFAASELDSGAFQQTPGAIPAQVGVGISDGGTPDRGDEGVGRRIGHA